jgi:uncharacterized membrane protein
LSRRKRASLFVLSLIFVAAGILHFVTPNTYVGIVPPWLPVPLALVYISGVAEIAGGVGLLVERSRRAAGVGLILLLLAVWPANIQMWVDASARDASDAEKLVLLLRIPLQLVLIWWVWRAAVRRVPRGESTKSPGVVVDVR